MGNDWLSDSMLDDSCYEWWNYNAITGNKGIDKMMVEKRSFEKKYVHCYLYNKDNTITGNKGVDKMIVEKRSFKERYVRCYLHNKDININECPYCDYYKGISNNDYTIILCSFEE